MWEKKSDGVNMYSFFGSEIDELYSKNGTALQ